MFRKKRIWKSSRECKRRYFHFVSNSLYFENLKHLNELKVKICISWFGKSEKNEIQRRFVGGNNNGLSVFKISLHSLLLFQSLKKETTEKLAAFCKSQDYPAFVKKLIVQGLIKIEEQEVEIQCKAEDKAIVSKVVGKQLKYSLCSKTIELFQNKQFCFILSLSAIQLE